MKLAKINWTFAERFVQNVDGINTLKSFSLIVLFVTTLPFVVPTFAQNSKDTSISSSSSNGDAFVKQMVDYSRPGKYHQVLAQLVGTWSFKGRRFPLKPDSNKAEYELFGTHVWKSFADDRYFIIDMTFGDDLHKIQMPTKDGKMKDVIGKGIMIEGYDNVKQKYVQAYITNHIGSDIAFAQGSYDATTKTITFDSEESVVPGMKDKIRQLLIIHDKNHYTLEYYNEQDGKYVKNTEVICTRVNGK